MSISNAERNDKGAANTQAEEEPERPLFLNGYPSLIPGDIGANPLHDIGLSFRALRERLRHLRPAK